MKKLILCFLILCACNGGGGGDDSTPEGADGIRVMHGVIDAPPYEVKVDGGDTIASARFAVPSSYGAIPEGTKKVKIVGRERPDITIQSFDLEVEDKSRFSILSFGTNLAQNTGFLLLKDQKRGDVDDGSAAVRFANSLEGGENIIVEFAGSNENVEAGTASGYLTVPAGATEIKIKSQGGSQLFLETKELEGGKAYTLFVAGKVGYFTSVSTFNG